MILDGLISLLANPMALLFMVVGICLGILLGALPGFGATIGIALLLPFTFGMSPQVALPMLVGVYCGALYGGSITAILVGVPGTSASAATVLDGYPMALKGETRKALALSVSACAVGGVFSGFCLLFLAPPLSYVTLWFGPAEYFMVALFGLSIISLVGGSSLAKGMIAGLLGILLSIVGIDPITGEERFTFGNLDLLDGFPLIPVILALFAFPRSLEFVRAAFLPKQEVKRGPVAVNQGSRLKLREFLGLWRVLVRSSVIGTIIGVMPAAGGNVACWVTYSEAKRKAKHPERFGTGALEGLAAPEAGHLATEGGSLIPMLTLSIPGSAPAAVLIGALLIHGLVPGPALFSPKYAAITYPFMWSVVISSCLMWVIGYYGSRYFAKIADIPTNTLAPLLLFFTLLGAYSARLLSFDLAVTVVLGTIFYLLTLAKYPMPPILLGYILGPIAEKGFRRALLISHGDWSVFFTRPICAVLIVIIVFSLYAGLKIMGQARRIAKIESEG